MALVAGRMQHRENDNGVLLDEKEDAIGKPSGKNAADLGALAKTKVKQWIPCCPGHRSTKLIEQTKS